MLAELKQARFPFEIALLLAFCIFLPLVEFWKNVAWLAYVLAWLVNRMRAGSVGGPWRWWDTLILLWLGSAYLSAAFSGLEGNAWGKTGDVAMHAVLLWLVVRADYSERELRWVLGALVASMLAGVALGYARIWSGIGKTGLMQLHSVGHVNHTGIYLAIMFGLCTSWLFARWQAWPGMRRGVALAVTVLAFAAAVSTTSRAAVGVGILALLILAIAWWPRWRGPLVVSAFATLVIAAMLVGFGAGVVQKQIDYVATQNALSFRDGIWRMGLAAWEKYPWFGVGKDNYGQITHERVSGWRTEAGKDYDAARYVRSPHAHNLYVNTLAERGIIGFAGLAALLLAWLAALVRRRPSPRAEDFAWLVWGGAASAWIVTAGVGMVNTTFHHEHGLLAVLLLGLWLQTLPRKA